MLFSSHWIYEIRQEGQVFEGGADAFRHALLKYSIKCGFNFRYVKNDQVRVTAECEHREETGCPWRIHASVDKINDFFYIRSFIAIHNCESV